MASIGAATTNSEKRPSKGSGSPNHKRWPVGGGAAPGPATVVAWHQPPEGLPYAMGWRSAEVDGTSILRHAGASADYRSDMFLIPDLGVGAAFLYDANHHLADDDFRRIARGVVRLVAGRPQLRTQRLPSEQ